MRETQFISNSDSYLKISGPLLLWNWSMISSRTINFKQHHKIHNYKAVFILIKGETQNHPIKLKTFLSKDFKHSLLKKPSIKNYASHILDEWIVSLAPIPTLLKEFLMLSNQLNSFTPTQQSTKPTCKKNLK